MGEDREEDKWRTIEIQEDKGEEEDMVRNWETQRAQDRRIQEVKGIVDRGVQQSPSRKRIEDDRSSSTVRRKKKLKHPVLEEDWGRRL